jgi:hypothetical protein
MLRMVAYDGLSHNRPDYDMRPDIPAAAMLTLIALAGCASTRDASVGEDRLVEHPCPAELQGQVVVSAAAVPRSIPPELATDEGFVKTYGVVGRRIMISVAPMDAARGMRILSSTLAVTTLGGTFEGWAALSDEVGSWDATRGARAPSRTRRANPAERRAIDVIPGRLRIAPFLSAPTLQAQTVMLDVLVTPGGVPVDELVVDESPLWTPDRRPIPPDALLVTLTPARHFTVFDVVDGKITLEFLATSSRSAHERWRCSFDTSVTLVEPDAERPPLWDLRTPVRGGKKKSWLALYDPKIGPIRAIFTSPATANGFASWLRQTSALRAGQFQLGVLQPADDRSPAPLEHSTADGFRPASVDELSALSVGRLGEP